MSWIYVGNKCRIFVEGQPREDIKYIVKGSSSKYIEEQKEVDIKENLTEEDYKVLQKKSMGRIAHVPLIVGANDKEEKNELVEEYKTLEEFKPKKKSLFLQRIHNKTNDVYLLFFIPEPPKNMLKKKTNTIPIGPPFLAFAANSFNFLASSNCFFLNSMSLYKINSKKSNTSSKSFSTFLGAFLKASFPPCLPDIF